MRRSVSSRRILRVTHQTQPAPAPRTRTPLLPVPNGIASRSREGSIPEGETPLLPSIGVRQRGAWAGTELRT
jgi:hypothetical protein